MATKLVSIVTGGSNNHETSSAEINGVATDFISQGVVGAVSNTSGVAPATGAFAVNAIGTPTMDVRVTGGVAYVTATPTGGTSQTFRVTMDSTEDVTIAANATGGTRYDWIYLKLDADKLVNPAVDASDVFTLAQSRSTSASTDNGTPPTYGYAIAVVTVANGASSITNSNITDSRTRTGANMIAGSVTLPTTTVINSKSFYNPYKFSAYRNAAANTGNGAFAVIAFDVENFDTNNNLSAGVYTAPLNGFYQFSWQAGVTTAASRSFTPALFKNGSEVARGTQNTVPTTVANHGGHVLIQLTAGDTVDVRAYCDVAQPLGVGAAITYFTGFLVSTT